MAADQLDPGHNPPGRIADAVVRASTGDPDEPPLPWVGVYLIAVLAQELGPFAALRAHREGVNVGSLRDTPFDKHGVGSRIIANTGAIERAELERLEQFASEKRSENGTAELGLSLAELTRMMDSNFDRAEGHRRRIDRALMDGEWPVLLKVLGKPSHQGRYLSLDELRALFVDQRLPERIVQRFQPSR
ncbi:MAG: hypothetical protein U0165_10640 [Polyangiaceae bacterium]